MYTEVPAEEGYLRVGLALVSRQTPGWNQAGYVRGGVKLCKIERKFGITA